MLFFFFYTYSFKAIADNYRINKITMDSEKSEKSNNSSFEDLSNLNENELKESSSDAQKSEEKIDDVLDIIGNGQITKKVSTHTAGLKVQQIEIYLQTYTHVL